MAEEDSNETEVRSDSADTDTLGADPHDIPVNSENGFTDAPAGIVSLREHSDDGRFHVTITTTVSDLGYDSDDYLRLTCNDGWVEKDLPPALQLDRLTDPSQNTLNNPRIRPIITIGSSYHLALPRRVLDRRGLDIDLKSGPYDQDDPFLFEKVYLSNPSTFFLHPLGHRSEVLRNDDGLPSPVPEDYITSVAEAFDIDQTALSAALETISRSLSPRTFEAAHLATADIEPIEVQLPSDRHESLGYQSVALHFTPADNRQSTLLELFTGLYRLSNSIAQGCWCVHQHFARDLIARAYEANGNAVTERDGRTTSRTEPQTGKATGLIDGIPTDHAVIDPDYEAVVLPVSTRTSESSS